MTTIRPVNSPIPGWKKHLSKYRFWWIVTGSILSTLLLCWATPATPDCYYLEAFGGAYTELTHTEAARYARGPIFDTPQEAIDFANKNGYNLCTKPGKTP